MVGEGFEVVYWRIHFGEDNIRNYKNFTTLSVLNKGKESRDSIK